VKILLVEDHLAVSQIVADYRPQGAPHLASPLVSSSGYLGSNDFCIIKNQVDISFSKANTWGTAAAGVVPDRVRVGSLEG
jgi:hypothetical protein